MGTLVAKVQRQKIRDFREAIRALQDTGNAPDGWVRSWVPLNDPPETINETTANFLLVEGEPMYITGDARPTGKYGCIVPVLRRDS